MSEASLGEQALHLYRVALHPELIEVASQDRLRDTELRARVALLPNGGQLVEVRRADNARPAASTVVVAPLSLELPEEGRVDLRLVASEPEVLLRESSRLDYEGGYRAEHLRARDYRARVVHLAHPPAEGFRRLIRSLGHPENQSAAPFSLLDVRLAAGLLETFGILGFPSEGALLFTHSRWRAG